MDSYFFSKFLVFKRLGIRALLSCLLISSLLLNSCQNSSETYLEKGKGLLREGKLREGIGYLNQAIEKDLDNAEAFNTRGVAYFELKEYPNAMLDFRQAINIDPQLYRPYFNRGPPFYRAKSPRFCPGRLRAGRPTRDRHRRHLPQPRAGVCLAGSSSAGHSGF